MATKKNYKYVIEIEVDTPVWPRHIADEVMNLKRFTPTHITVTDQQNDGHIYGSTYTVNGDSGRQWFPRLQLFSVA